MASTGEQWRLEIDSLDSGTQARRMAERARMLLGPVANDVRSIHATALYFVAEPLDEAERKLLGDAVVDAATQQGAWVVAHEEAGVRREDGRLFVEVSLRPGVTDPVGDAFSRAAALLGIRGLSARSGTRYLFDAEVDHHVRELVAGALLHNDIVDEISFDAPILARFIGPSTNDVVEVVSVRDLSDHELAALSRDRGLALDPAELVAVREFFVSIDRDPTDAEI